MTTCPSATIAVPIKVEYFFNVGGISLTLNYDPAILQYQSVDLNPAITGSFSNGATPGIFILSFTSDPGVTLANNAMLFTLKFTGICPTAAVTSYLTWSETPPEANEYSTPAGIAYNKVPFGNYFINGSVTVIPDNEAPVISTSPGSLNRTLVCSNASGIADALDLVPAATDNCTNPPIIHLLSDITTPDPACLTAYQRVRTWNFTDHCNNTSADYVQTITVTPPAMPVFASVNDITVDCGLATESDLSYTNSLTGDCEISGSVTSTLSAQNPAGVCGGDITETWTVIICGNTITKSRLIHVSPAALPVMTPLAATSVPCGTPMVPTTVSYTNGLPDGCLITGTSELSTFSITPGPCGGTITETWTATDICGRALSPVSRTITVEVAELPVLTPLAATSVPCGTPMVPSVISYTNGLTAGCLVNGTSDLSTFSVTPGSCGGTITETWTATDICGRALAPVSRTITVEAADLPVMTPLAATFVPCGTPMVPTTVGYTNGLIGGCLINGTSNLSTFSTTPGPCGGTITETWTATDICGRTLSPVSRTITVEVAELPVMTPLAATSVPCGTPMVPSAVSYTKRLPAGWIVNGTSDLSTFSVTPGSCGGTITETWTATDICGRTLAPVSRTITVEVAELPVMTPLAATSVPCGTPMVPTTVSYTNNLPKGCLINGTSNPSTFSTTPGPCGGTITETWTAADVCGRALASVSRSITVEPVALPTIVPLPDITVACGTPMIPSAVPYSNGFPKGCLISGMSDLSTFSATPGPCGGTITETWTATDICGRVLTPVSRIITVSPAALPTMTALADITVDCGEIPLPSTLSFSNGMSPGCLITGTSNPSVITITVPGNCNGKATETWTAADICGRPLAPVTRIITIHDNTAPTISCPSSPQIRIISEGSTSYTANGNEFDYTSLNDNCGNVSATNNLNGLPTLAGYIFPPGITAVTWTALDECGNTASCTFDVTIYAPSVMLEKTGILDLTVVPPDDVANVGDQINYIFTVTNTGNSTLTSVVVTDPVLTINGMAITLAPGASDNTTFTGTYTLQVLDIRAGTFTNIATATGFDPLGGVVSDTDDDTQNFIFIAGNIYDDADGMSNSIVSGSPTNGSGNIYINLVSPVKGVVSSKLVNPDGTFYFTIDDGVEFDVTYNLILTNSQQAEGSTLTSATYPTNWVSTGEILGAGTGNDGIIDGILAVTTTGGSVDNANFGLDQLPVAFPVTGYYANPGGTLTVTVPLLHGTDAEDGPLGSTHTIKIMTLAANGTLYYNGIAVIAGQTIIDYNPAFLEADPNDGDVVVTFAYAFIDAAGMLGPPAIVTLYFYACPEILTQPMNATACLGGTVDLSINVDGGSSTVAYQWQVSFVDCQNSFSDIQGATNSTFTSPPINATTYFRCLIASSNPLCATIESSCATITVNPGGQVNQPTSIVVCNGSNASVAFETMNTGGTTTYLWSNNTTSIGLEASGTGDISFTAVNTGTASIAATIVVTPVHTIGGVSCPGPSKSFTITANPSGQVNDVASQVVCNGSSTDPVILTTANTGGITTYSWTNDQPGIGLASSGSGNIPSFTGVNTGNAPVVATITVTPTFEKKAVSCTGDAKTFTITVNPAGQVNDPGDQIVCNGAYTMPVIFSTNNTGGTTTYFWTIDQPGIGLVSGGSGNIPLFAAVNSGNTPVVATLTVIPVFEKKGVNCPGSSETFTITVNPSGQVNDPPDQLVCNGVMTNAVIFSTNNLLGTTTYTWTNNTPTIGLSASGSGNIGSFTALNSSNAPVVAMVTVTPHYSSGLLTCDGVAETFTITVNPSGQVNDPSDQALCNGSLTTAIVFTTNNIVGSTTYTWTNNAPSIGLAASGSGNIPAFTASNTGTLPLVATITVTPHFTFGFVKCDGPSEIILITINPTPILVTNPQSACSPNKVDLTAPAVTSGSTPGLIFTYWTNAAATVPYPTPTMAPAGTYYIKGTLPATGCYAIKPVTVTINPLPTTFYATGSGGYCAGGQGRQLGLSGSQIGVLYTLWYDCCNPVGGPVAGTGGPIVFPGYQTLPGFYSVHAENTTTHCSAMMYNCALIWIDQPVPVGISILVSANPSPAGNPVTFTAIPVNGGTAPFFQWKVNSLVTGTNSSIFTYVPLNDDEVTCVLTSNVYCVSGNPASAAVIMQVDGIIPAITVPGIIGNGQLKCYSATETLTVAGNGNTFTVQGGGSVTMIAGLNIRFLPGTTVQPYGYLHGYITINNQYCGQQTPSIPAVVAGEAEAESILHHPYFSVYPNPTSGTFTLEQKSAEVFEKVQVEFYGMGSGKIKTVTLQGEKKHDFSISEFPDGVYLVKVITGGYVKIFKLIKTR
ncbi:MAG: HYR domain-containing protein [Bacteroidales bacterium]|nr:HYR domain-containing protein [Bacteroidales bacterium]